MRERHMPEVSGTRVELGAAWTKKQLLEREMESQDGRPGGDLDPGGCYRLMLPD